jgi:peptide/nickel transport system ATP-binding protein
VGESGCGKTTLVLSLLRLLPVTGRVTQGEVWFRGRDLMRLSEADIQQVRWGEISVVFQGAMNAMNPVRTIADQIGEAIRRHRPGMDRGAVANRVVGLLDRVGIGGERGHQFPHQYSGGMRQRAMIAMALACEPSLLIADEPTTALDVMIQAQILKLLADLQADLGLALILVSHDLGVVAEMCDRVLVMYGGVTAEEADVDRVFNSARHPYTQELLKAFPDISSPSGKLASIPGYPPRLDPPPPGCRFAARCPQVFERCHREQPALHTVGSGHRASCHWVETT